MGKPNAVYQIGTEWAKHLRPRLKRIFWRRLRVKAKLELRVT